MFRSSRRRWAIAALLAGVLATGPLGAPAAHADTDVVGDFLFVVDKQTRLPGGLTVENEDVVRFNSADGTYSLVFDGSDVGLSGFRIDALATLPITLTPCPVPVPIPGPPVALQDPVPVPCPVPGPVPPVVVFQDEPPVLIPTPFATLVMSFTKGGTVPGVGHVDDSDLVLFQPTFTTLDFAAAQTAGTFSLFFDGSDIGLTHSSEDVDAVEIVGDDLYLSTLGSFHAEGEHGSNEDIFVCREADTGPDSDCEDLDIAFDGSDAELSRSGENVDAFSLPAPQVIIGPPVIFGAEDDDASDGPVAVFSTNGDFHAGGASGDDDDLFACDEGLDDCEDDPDFDVIFRGSRHGVRGVDIEAIDLVPALPVFSPLPQADLALAKVDSPDPVNSGDVIIYTLRLTNNGPDTAFNSAVTDTLPPGVTPVATNEPGCDITNPPVVTCNFDDIPSGGFVEWTITVDTEGHPGGDITNSAEAFIFFQVDPDSSNNTASATTTVTPLA